MLQFKPLTEKETLFNFKQSIDNVKKCPDHKFVYFKPAIIEQISLSKDNIIIIDAKETIMSIGLN